MNAMIAPLTIASLMALAGGDASSAEAPVSMTRQLASLGDQARDQGRLEDARTFYRNALMLDPVNAPARASLDRIARAQDARGAMAPTEPSALERQAAGKALAREAFVTDVRQRIQEGRDLANSGRPSLALARLRDTLDVVRAGDALPEELRRRLENQVSHQVGAAERLEERSHRERAELYRIGASQAAQTAAVDGLLDNQRTTQTLIGEFDTLMSEGQFLVLESGGLGDIDVTRQPFVDALDRARKGRARSPYTLAPWAGMFVADTIGFHSQSIQYDLLKEYRAMLTWADVDRSAVPFPDTKAIEYPQRRAWQELSERRIARYGDSEYIFDRDSKTKAILAALNKSISMPFANDTPLDDVIKYIQQSTQDEVAGLPNGIPIYVEPQSLQDIDKTLTSATVTINLQGIPLKTTLRLLLKQIQLTYSVKDGLMKIVSNKSEDIETELRVYYTADLAIIPISLIGGGAGGGGIGGGGGGLGGGGGGIGGGGGGFGGGGLGGGGIGGFQSIAPSIR